MITLRYLIYPPNYNPGDGYKEAKTSDEAVRIGIRFGIGAEIHQVRYARPGVKRCNFDRWTSCGTIKTWTIIKKRDRNGNRQRRK
jgi:hypothetical protein